MSNDNNAAEAFAAASSSYSQESLVLADKEHWGHGRETRCGGSGTKGHSADALQLLWSVGVANGRPYPVPHHAIDASNDGAVT